MNKLHRHLRALLSRPNENLDVEQIEIFLPSLPPALDGYRFAVVSDLHIRHLADYHQRIAAAVIDTRPDCILVLGDTMDESTGLIMAMTPFFQALVRTAPTIAILGNNDCLIGRIHTLRAMYREAGVTLLENETRLLDARGLPIRITGLMDPLAAMRGIEPAHAARPSQYTPLGESLSPKAEIPGGIQPPSLLLLHRPDLAPEYAALSPTLILAGHAHGGQIRLPGIGGLYAPDQGILPRYTSGLYQLGASKLIVSRGLGNHCFPLRVNNRPHIPVVVLRGG